MVVVRLFVLSLVLSAVLGDSTDNIATGVVCRSYLDAKRNGVLEECKKLWISATTTDTYIKSNDCRLCKEYLEQKDFLTLASVLLPSQDFTKADVEEIKRLASYLGDDTLLCGLLGQCSNQSFILPSLKFELGSTCDDCKKIFDDIRALIKDNETKTAVTAYVKTAICYKLPLTIVDFCKSAADLYTGFLMELAANKIESVHLCALVDLCPKVLNLTKKPEVKSDFKTYSWIKRPSPVGFEFFHSRLSYPNASDESDPCDECIQVFSRIRDQTKDPEFNQAIKNVAKQKCEATISRQVDSMIDNASQVNITELCTFLKQCPASRAGIKLNKSAELKIYLPPKNLYASIPFVCPVCEILIQKVIDLTLTNRTEDAIVWSLHETCHLLPHSWNEKCLVYVDKYSDFIVREILAGTLPKVICHSLGACNPVVAPPTPFKDSKCMLCEVIVHLITQKLEDNATQDTIREDLKKMFSYLPHVSTRFVEFVDKYTPMVIKLLAEGVSPEEVCQKEEFCSQVAVSQSSMKDSCTVCQVLVAELYSKLRDDITIDHVEGFLENFCNYIFSAYVKKCQSWVEQNTPFLIDLIIKKYPPIQVCEELSICYHQVPNLHRIGGKCEVCKEIIDFIYGQLEDDATAQQVEKVLETVCRYLPNENLRATCREYVNAYNQIIIDYLVKHVPSKVICQHLRFCPSDNLLKRLCKDDPSFWCRDKLTAGLCNREDFCEAFIWEPALPSDSKPRPPVVRKYDCSKLSTLEDRCSNERLMRLCGFEAFCGDYKRPPGESYEDCSFCRGLITRRLTYGSFALDCSIYIDASKRKQCERVLSIRIPGRLAFNNIDLVCKENQLCDSVPQSSSLNDDTEVQSLLGGDPCLWGPSVTCRDVEIAARCGVTKYCQSHVWGSSHPQPRAGRVPGIALVDCSRPLSELCVSPSLRYCGPSVLERCRVYANSEAGSDDLRREMCKDRPLSFCSDAKMVKLCAMGEYCEAMGVSSTPATPQATESSRDGRCLSLAFACQNYASAVLCDRVEMCRQKLWH